MRISLLKKGKIYNTNLPVRINGSFWVEDRDKNNLSRNLINICAKDNKWCMKSNFDTKIIYNGNVIEELMLENFACFELQVRGEKYNYFVCTSPVYDDNSTEFDVGVASDIYIGNDATNTINYSNPYIAQRQCLLSLKGGIWHIQNLTNSGVLFA